jgi:hypothetical protein
MFLFVRDVTFFIEGPRLKTPAATDDALLGNAQKQTAPLIPCKKQRCASASSTRCRPESDAAFLWLMH